MPGEYSTGSRPAPHKVEVATGEPGNPHVYTDQNEPGRPDHHTVNYDIWDHRDNPMFARITLTARRSNPHNGGLTDGASRSLSAMSLIFATQLTAIATAVLAVFAIITAWYARRVFLKQSQKVRAIEQQVSDGPQRLSGDPT